MARILVVEDDANLAQGLRYNLERAGYEVVHAAKGPEGLRLAREATPDLLILDLMLPGLHGFELLARLREGGSRVPVIILTVQDAEVDKIRGFDAGADDYLTKPFGIGELLARIRARLRKEGDPAEVAVAGGVLRLEALVFERGGERVPLTPTEADILRALCRRRGDPVRREELLRSVWGVADLVTRTLDTHVTRLRRKIEPDPAQPRHILTVHGVGYRLVP
ncbi:MAG: response regulator transcription factor [Planctomycetes bacterium]|nr:response regulator transcription factor [Planctomycetota bacterium]